MPFCIRRLRGFLWVDQSLDCPELGRVLIIAGVVSVIVVQPPGKTVTTLRNGVLVTFCSVRREVLSCLSPNLCAQLDCLMMQFLSRKGRFSVEG